MESSPRCPTPLLLPLCPTTALPSHNKDPLSTQSQFFLSWQSARFHRADPPPRPRCPASRDPLRRAPHNAPQPRQVRRTATRRNREPGQRARELLASVVFAKRCAEVESEFRRVQTREGRCELLVQVVVAEPHAEAAPSARKNAAGHAHNMLSEGIPCNRGYGMLIRTYSARPRRHRGSPGHRSRHVAKDRMCVVCLGIYRLPARRRGREAKLYMASKEGRSSVCLKSVCPCRTAGA